MKQSWFLKEEFIHHFIQHVDETCSCLLTHQKTDETGPETHQRAVIPEKDEEESDISERTGERCRRHIPAFSNAKWQD